MPYIAVTFWSFVFSPVSSYRFGLVEITAMSNLVRCILNPKT